MKSSEIVNLWTELYPKVFGYFFRRVNNREDVEDLTSLTLTNFFDKLKIQEIRHPEAYLWRIAHNQLISFFRHKSKQPVIVPIEDETGKFEIDEEIETEYSTRYKNRLNLLQECIQNSLKSDDYEIVKLSIIEDKKSNEIAEMLNLTSVNVRKKLSRAIQKVRKKCSELWK